jgi:hypothetical protein
MCAGYAGWTDRGILADLRQLHGIADPPLALLQTIARCVAAVLSRQGLALGRAELRSRMPLIGWFNRNYNVIEPLIPNVVICDEARRSTGRMAAQFDRYCNQNPNAPVLHFLNGHRPDADEGRNTSR